MRVLIVHNRYSSRVPSGENLAVDDEVRWLREAGVDVARHEVSNDEVVAARPVDRARRSVEAIWSRSAQRRFVAAVDEHRPDVVHVHNLFPLFTASLPSAALARGLPVVWTVHNFRTTCVAGTHFRAGRRCDECRPGWRAPGVVHRCYADSAVASLLVTSATSWYRSLARSHDVTAVAISAAVGRWLVERAGFDGGRVRVKLNGVDRPTAPVGDPASRAGFVYLGRLSPDKGVGVLLEAWRRSQAATALDVVGDGPMAGDVVAAAAADPRITWSGAVPSSEVGTHIAAARAVVVPSTWDEPFGRVAAEALSYGRPVITTGHGGLAEIVSDDAGWITGSDPAALTAAIDDAARSDEVVAAKGAAARERHDTRFSPEATTAVLIDIYREAIERAGRHSHRAG